MKRTIATTLALTVAAVCATATVATARPEGVPTGPPPGVGGTPLPAEMYLVGPDGERVKDSAGKPVKVSTAPDALPPIEQFHDRTGKVHPQWAGRLPAVTEPDGKGGRKVRPADREQKPTKKVKGDDGQSLEVIEVPGR